MRLLEGGKPFIPGFILFHRLTLVFFDRYIVSNSARGGLWLNDIARILKKHFPYHPIPTYGMPYFLFKLLSYIDARVTPELLQDRTVVSTYSPSVPLPQREGSLTNASR